MGLNMDEQEVSELELRKWCLEFIMDQKEYLGVSDLTMEAEKLLDFVKGEEKTEVAPVKPLNANEVDDADLIQLDWSGFRSEFAVLGGGLHWRSKDGRMVYLSDSGLIDQLKVLWVKEHGIPNKGKSDD